MYLFRIYKGAFLSVAAGAVPVLVALGLLASSKLNSSVEKTIESVSHQESGPNPAPEQTPGTADSASVPTQPERCKPTALGTSRTIIVDPRAHSRIGAMSYAETLPLQDKEVVL